MDNERARKLQIRIIQLSNRPLSLTSIHRDEFEEANNEFELELMYLPPEAKKLDNNGYLIPWRYERERDTEQMV